ncbi:MAG: hypothetical protein LUG60_06600 [Erysipelotrichaceae bacterium]|nr:hypothetical protein [Erysipelotrichaceae bacterium]
MKIGILTYVHAVNYGAVLQAYALCKRLNEENDIEAELIDFRMKKEIKYYVKETLFKKTFFVYHLIYKDFCLLIKIQNCFLYRKINWLVMI